MTITPHMEDLYAAQLAAAAKVENKRMRQTLTAGNGWAESSRTRVKRRTPDDIAAVIRAALDRTPRTQAEIVAMTGAELAQVRGVIAGLCRSGHAKKVEAVVTDRSKNPVWTYVRGCGE